MHASIKGMHVISKEFARKVAEHVLHLQGHLRNKKAQAAWAAGALQVIHKPLYLKANRIDFAVVGNMANECHELAILHPRDTDMPIISLCCPTCSFQRKACGFSLYRNACFSNVICNRCKVVHSSRKWLCECGVAWTKCDKHIPITRKRKAQFTDRRVALRRKFGTDKPFPVSRKRDVISVSQRTASNEAVSSNAHAEPCKRMCLRPGTKLAQRFPHLVKRAGPIKGTGPDEGMPDIQNEGLSGGR